MIQNRARVKVADNSGTKEIECIQVIGGFQKRYTHVGERFTGVVKSAVPHATVKKAEIVTCVLVRSKKELRRSDGSYIRFSDNACVVIDKKSGEPKGSRIFGPIPREVRKAGYAKIASLAPEVL